jgi:hypothetical protein
MSKELDISNTTHLLRCRHTQGGNTYRYFMRCHILKSLTKGGKAKVLVWGDRYWDHSDHKSRVIYVAPHRVVTKMETQDGKTNE